MASLDAHLRSLAKVHTDLCELIGEINGILEKASPEQRFVTLLAARFDCEARIMRYVRCGHPPGFIMSAEGEVTAWLEHGDLPLGSMPDTPLRPSAAIQLRSGDVVVMLTDGVLEALSPEGVQFGVDRTVEVVRDRRSRSAVQIVEALRKAVGDHTAQEELSDALTLIVIKVG